MRAEQSKFIASMAGSSIDDLEFLESNQEASMADDDYVQEEDKQMCSFCRDPDSQRPLCYLIHFQVCTNIEIYNTIYILIINS